MTRTMTRNSGDDYDIIASCGDKGDRWAKAFCERNPVVDEGTMIAWFANAIEAACTVREQRRKKMWCERIRRWYRGY